MTSLPLAAQRRLSQVVRSPGRVIAARLAGTFEVNRLRKNAAMSAGGTTYPGSELSWSSFKS